jgi:hypothetical protein
MPKTTSSTRYSQFKSKFIIGLSLSLIAFSLPAIAGETEATAEINRADAKIEMVTRQAGQAGDKGDQSFNMSRQKLIEARAAKASGNYDTAQMLAEQSSLLASLTAEKAILASLQASHDTLLKSTSAQ